MQFKPTLMCIRQEFVPQLRWLNTGFIPQTAGLNSRAFHVEFVIEKASMGQGFLQSLWFSPTSDYYTSSITTAQYHSEIF
jgi:hypothetical protein